MKHRNVLALGGPLDGRIIDHHRDEFLHATDAPLWVEEMCELHSYEVVNVRCDLRGPLKVFAHEEITWGHHDKERRVLALLGGRLP